MEILFLGTGTGVPSAHRGSPGMMVQSDGLKCLVDIGSGVLRQLARAGIPFSVIDAILLTHFHPDHVGDLVPFLFALRNWAMADRPVPIQVFGAEGLLEMAGRLRAAFGRWIEPGEDKVIFREIPTGAHHRLTLDNLTVESFPIPHTAQSLGYRLTDARGRCVALSGDTDYGPGLIDLAGNADLFVTECSLPEGRKMDGHLTPSLAGRAAREAGAGKLALTHFYPDTEGEDLLTGVRTEFPGPVVLVDDLMWLTVS